LEVRLPWGNPAEKARAERIADGLDNAVVLPKLNLAGVARVLAAAQGCVAVDTGLGHLAAALDVPTLSLFGPTNPGLTGAYGKSQVHLAADYPACAPCLQKKCTYRPTPEDQRQVDTEREWPMCFTRLNPERADRLQQDARSGRVLRRRRLLRRQGPESAPWPVQILGPLPSFRRLRAGGIRQGREDRRPPGPGQRRRYPRRIPSRVQAGRRRSAACADRLRLQDQRRRSQPQGAGGPACRTEKTYAAVCNRPGRPQGIPAAEHDAGPGRARYVHERAQRHTAVSVGRRPVDPSGLQRKHRHCAA
nr:heat shock protein, putative [Tanacetum cinerariifolium]